MHSSRFVLLLVLLLPPLLYGSHAPPARKALPTLSSIGIRSLSVEH